jgi:hypothetical protein
VLLVQHDYQDGAKGLATAIRKADPPYDPSKDQDLSKAGKWAGQKVTATIERGMTKVDHEARCASSLDTHRV